MKKNILKTTLVAAFALLAGYNVYNSQKAEGMSELALANVKALANANESDDQDDCMSASDLCSILVIYPDGWGEDIAFDRTKRPGWVIIRSFLIN